MRFQHTLLIRTPLSGGACARAPPAPPGHLPLTLPPSLRRYLTGRHRRALATAFLLAYAHARGPIDEREEQVDVVDLAVAFAVSSVVSLGLVTSYLRIVQGAKAAFLQAGTAQLIFLVGFSLAFFHEGQTGLTIAIGSVVTLFVLMQLTARVRWTEVFGGVDVDMGPIGGAPVGVPGLTGVAVATSPTDNHAD